MENKQRKYLTDKLEELKINPDTLSKNIEVNVAELSKFIMGENNLTEIQLIALSKEVNESIEWVKNENETEGEMKNMTDKKIENLESILTERESMVIKYRLGMDGNKPMSLEEVGEKLGITRERVRQIEAKAERRLRHPALAGFKVTESSGANELVEQNESEILPNDSISKLELSVRPLACLENAGIRTISDLASKSKKEIKANKNLGNTSFVEVINKLQEFGIILK